MPDTRSPISSTNWHDERILFVTGKLAERQVREAVAQAATQFGFRYAVHVVNISVAALIHADWLLRRWQATRFDPLEPLQSALPHDSPGNLLTRIVLPGWCQGDLTPLVEWLKYPVERGPKDIHDLPTWLGAIDRPPVSLDRFDIEILAEINHAPRLSVRELLQAAAAYQLAGADMIDLGCIPGESWTGIAEAVRLLREQGIRVSVDSFDQREVEAAVTAGAELVLSGNSSNADWGVNLPAEWVIIPDDPRDLSSLWNTAGRFRDQQRPTRLDPVLEPVGYGFTASLARYYEVRRRDPLASMMMGIGNVTELSEVDSAGINFLLAAICQELDITSVLTTSVIYWCQETIREFDRARRLVKHAIDNATLPKHVNSGLVMLHAGKQVTLGRDQLLKLAQQITDPNYRIFVEGGEIHVMNREGYWHGTDAYELFDNLHELADSLDATHAFYLGYELSKAVTALTLGKKYTQDESLCWGMLTLPEPSAHERHKRHPISE